MCLTDSLRPCVGARGSEATVPSLEVSGQRLETRGGLGAGADQRPEVSSEQGVGARDII